MTDTKPQRAPSREDLNAAIDQLIERQRVKLRREGTEKVEWQTIPSLWEQLETSAMWSGEGAGGGAFGARPVISTGVVDLLIKIGTATMEGAVEYATNRKNVPGNLRAISANMPAEPDLDTWWTENVRGWIAEARKELRLDPAHPQWARGVPCPECGARQAQSQRDGETVLTPALAITWTRPEGDEHRPDSDWKVRAVECRNDQCGKVWWRGESLDDLVQAMILANQTQETMTVDGVA